jgi:uncharacterized RDD family membrane protein YckC
MSEELAVAAPAGYAGLVTRAVALLLDLLAVNAIAVLTGGAIDLIVSLFSQDSSLNAAQALAGGALWLLWIGLYFVVFWTLAGQTPGDRLLGIRVISTIGERIRIRQAILRFIGLLLSALPLGAGFLPILVDDRRRGLHDRLANTVVRWDSEKLSEVPMPEPALAAEAEMPVVPLAGQHLSVG